MDAKELIESTPQTWRQQYPDLPKNGETTNRHEWLVLDGEVLKEHPFDHWIRAVPGSAPGPLPTLVTGTTAHASHSENLFNKHKSWTPELVRQYIQQSVIGDSGLVDEVLKRYEASYKGLVQIISDIRTVCPLLVITRFQATGPFYVVTQKSDELEISHVDDDIQAILGRYEPKTQEQLQYAQVIQQLFFNYATNGEFQQYESQKRVFMIDQDVRSNNNYPNCDFWITRDIVPRYSRMD